MVISCRPHRYAFVHRFAGRGEKSWASTFYWILGSNGKSSMSFDHCWRFTPSSALGRGPFSCTSCSTSPSERTQASPRTGHIWDSRNKRTHSCRFCHLAREILDAVANVKCPVPYKWMDRRKITKRHRACRKCHLHRTDRAEG